MCGVIPSNTNPLNTWRWSKSSGAPEPPLRASQQPGARVGGMPPGCRQVGHLKYYEMKGNSEAAVKRRELFSAMMETKREEQGGEWTDWAELSGDAVDCMDGLVGREERAIRAPYLPHRVTELRERQKAIDRLWEVSMQKRPGGEVELAAKRERAAALFGKATGAE